jgi:hypothetical protein
MADIFDPNVRRIVTTLRVRVACTCTHWAGPNHSIKVAKQNTDASLKLVVSMDRFADASFDG